MYIFLVNVCAHLAAYCPDCLRTHNQNTCSISTAAAWLAQPPVGTIDYIITGNATGCGFIKPDPLNAKTTQSILTLSCVDL